MNGRPTASRPTPGPCPGANGAPEGKSLIAFQLARSAQYIPPHGVRRDPPQVPRLLHGGPPEPSGGAELLPRPGGRSHAAVHERWDGPVQARVSGEIGRASCRERV